MNSMGLAIFAIVAVVCLSTSSALPAGLDPKMLRQKQDLAALLDEIHNTYTRAVKRNFCDDPFLDSLTEDFCKRKRSSVIPNDFADFVARSKRDTAAAADQE